MQCYIYSGCRHFFIPEVSTNEPLSTRWLERVDVRNVRCIEVIFAVDGNLGSPPSLVSRSNEVYLTRVFTYSEILMKKYATSE